MSDEVSELMKLALNKPVRISVDPLMQTNRKLVQEFIKIGEDDLEDKDAIILGTSKSSSTF